MDDEQTLAPAASDEGVQTEVEQTEAPEAVDSTTGQDENQPADDDAEGTPEAEAEERKSKSAERRERRKAQLDELRQSEAAATTAAEDANKRIADLKQAAASIPKPKQADYSDFEQYQADITAFRMAEMIDGRELQKLEADAKAHFAKVNDAKTTQKQADAQNWAAQQEEGRAKYPDFDQVVATDALKISATMAEMIVQSDDGDEVAYYLGKNPDVAAQIYAMGTPVEVARAMGRLEAQVSAPKPKMTSTAPAPVNPVKGKATASQDPENMGPAAYRAWIDKGGKF